jgi:hypothetical protein
MDTVPSDLWGLKEESVEATFEINHHKTFSTPSDGGTTLRFR